MNQWTAFSNAASHNNLDLVFITSNGVVTAAAILPLILSHNAPWYGWIDLWHLSANVVSPFSLSRLDFECGDRVKGFLLEKELSWSSLVIECLSLVIESKVFYWYLKYLFVHRIYLYCNSQLYLWDSITSLDHENFFPTKSLWLDHYNRNWVDSNWMVTPLLQINAKDLIMRQIGYIW